MRFRPAARAIVAGAGLVATGLALTAARADIFLDSPIIPTSSIVATGAVLPTSYVVPTSSILSTSYVVPTTSIVSSGSSVYYPTSSYATTGYYRGGLFRPRRYIERTSYYDSVGSYVSPTVAYSVAPTSYLSSSFVPTSYYSGSILPTSYVVPSVSTSTLLPTTILSRPILTPTSVILDDSAVVATSTISSVCCTDGGSTSRVVESIAVDPTPTAAVVPRSITSAPRTLGNAVVSQPSGSAASTATPATIPNPERFPTREINPTEPPPAPVAPAAPKPAAGVTSPPEPAAGAIAPTAPLDVPVPGPGEMSKPNTDPGPAPKTDEATTRTSFKPIYTGTGMPSARNVLRGKVVAWRTNRPEEGVQVVIANATGAFRSRPAMTDARGEFSVSLPDGDWTVQVRMPSGSLLAAGEGVTATSGQVIDEASGQNVIEYLIRR